MNSKVPIILSVYSRPDLAEQVINAISFYKPKKIYVIADGPKDEQDISKCITARNVIERIDWECDIRKNYSEKNLGPGVRISSGITWSFKTCDRAIVLEEDCIPHPSFFHYCEELLEKYRLNEKIGLITGTCFLDGTNTTDSYYFSNYPHLWGWATWKRFWDKYSYSISDWKELKRTTFVKEKVESKYYSKIWRSNFNQVMDGKIDTWDYQVIYLMWKNDQFGIVPKENLVRNIGFDSRSAHTKRPNKLFCSLKHHKLNFPLKHPIEINRNLSNDKMHLLLLYGDKPTFLSLLIGRVYRFYKKSVFYHNVSKFL